MFWGQRTGQMPQSANRRWTNWLWAKHVLAKQGWAKQGWAKQRGAKRRPMTAAPVTALRTLLDLAELTVSGTPAGDGSKGRVRARLGVERQQTLPKEVVEQGRRPWLRGG